MPQAPHNRIFSRVRTPIACLTVIAAFAVLPAVANAEDADLVGGSFPSADPKVSAVECVEQCVGLDRAAPGSTVQVTGSNLFNVTNLVFLGGTGTSDNVTVPVKWFTEEAIRVVVPKEAKSGPVRVRNKDGALSGPTKLPLTLSPASEIPKGGDVPEIEAKTKGGKIFFGAKAKAELRYLVKSAHNVDIRIDVVNKANGISVYRKTLRAQQPGSARTVKWNGIASSGKAAPSGKYNFQVMAADASSSAVTKSSVSTKASTPEGDILLLDHMFPIRGAHNWGTYPDTYFGNDRGDHKHAGQDVLAKCGTPIVAARGGVVKEEGVGGETGNLVVIDGLKTDVDYAYYHLRDRALVKKGDKVDTGQLIGFVGQTGNASVCHLHFELWKGPYWGGGHVFDPLPLLKAWDNSSVATPQRKVDAKTVSTSSIAIG